MTALNVVYEVEERRVFIRRTTIALAMSVGMVAVLLLAILAVSALNFLENLIPELGGLSQILLKALFFALAGGAVILLLALIYRYGPDRPEAEWKWITPGSVLATIVWIVATLGFGVYVANFGNYNATYGSLGAVIVFLTWLYLTAYVVLFGAELNSMLELEVGPEKVKDEEAAAGDAAPGKAATAARAAAAERSARAATIVPSLPKLVARLGIFSMIATLLGRSRRPRLQR